MPRPTTRDAAAINVVWPEPLDASGSGTAEEGGGPLAGGLELANRFTVEIDDPAVPFRTQLTLAAIGHALAVDHVALKRRGDDSPAITGAGLRKVVLDTYVTRVREELGAMSGRFLIREARPLESTTNGPEAVAYSQASDDRWSTFDDAQKRQRQRRESGPLTVEMIAEAYREALRSSDAKTRRAPTATVAQQFGVHRGHAARLVSRARRAGLLSAATPGRASS